jgi:polyhydroxybutyrate depolymerase
MVGCSQTASSPAGQQGTGGSGTGGVVDSGGSVGTGGQVGTGGATVGSGGSVATGGTTAGTGGTTAGTGGRTSGSGGRTGGRSGTGGQVGTGGSTTDTGGTTTGTGGSTVGTGGSTSGSGGTAAGGRTGSGGASASGGGTGTGGGSGSGGATGSGGNGVASPGCGKSITRPNNRTQQTLSIGGTTRYYLLDVPSSADNQTPLMLIFALHGYDMNNVSVVGLYNFTSRSNGKAITVYPQGEGPAPGDTSHWGDGVLKSTWTANDANYNFIETLMADLEDRFCIDTSRVFITGFSMGGMFTNSIACAHNDWFRGFAPVEGMGPGSCSNANAKPAIIIHQGTGDTLVTPSSGGEPTRDFWLKQNGCSQTTTSAFTGCQSYGACAEPVVYCVGGWDHTINSTISGNVWSFFNGLP